MFFRVSIYEDIYSREFQLKLKKGPIIEELEPNYEIQVFRKSDNKFMDSYFTYSDDKSTALDEAIKYFKDEYLISDYNFLAEYWGEFQSDRGYEMSFDS
ncbi:MAG: hypothetical protein AB7D41_13015 [Arcobacter sp.]|uniref:hypothetical protein n=1 Tax=Arcobacter sp. TaxID=1872629 RepID=UPI003CFEBC82